MEHEPQPDRTWPPAYNLRLSTKARHAHLKVIPNKGLEVVIPSRMQKYFKVEELLSKKKAWIEKHLSKLVYKPLIHIHSLDLKAIEQTWTIRYQQTESANIQAIVLPGNNLVLHGNIQDIELTHSFLQNWLKKLARTYLVPWIQRLSLEYGLPIQNISIRAQRTLWGSCTADKNISLNYKLLFVPAEYAKHVLLHELCHTKYLNHSARFWSLLNKLDPNTEQHNQAIRESDGYVPYGL